MVVSDGDDIKLVCIVSGSPELIVEWFKDEKIIETATDRHVKFHFRDGICTLVIKKSTSDNEGMYKCIVRNDYGTARSSANVVVKRRFIKPHITQWLNNLIITTGDSAVFEVGITGFEKPTLEWFHGVTKLVPGGRYEMIEQENDKYLLKISDIKDDDYGTYQCVASNNVGKAFSQAILQVVEKQISPAFEQRDVQETLVYREGDEINLVMTIRGHPPPMVAWYKDGKVLYGGRGVSIQSRGDSYFLVINKALVDHTGTYKCEARNMHGSTFRMFDIKVEGMYLDASFPRLKYLHTKIIIFYTAISKTFNNE